MGVTLQGSVHPSVSHQTMPQLLCRTAAMPPWHKYPPRQSVAYQQGLGWKEGDPRPSRE